MEWSFGPGYRAYPTEDWIPALDGVDLRASISR
jgi:hypothetical protein